VPFVGTLVNIGPNGLGGCVVNHTVDEQLYIGDEVTLEFALPWCSDVFRVAAITCSKSPYGEPGHLLIGFEFSPRENDPHLLRLRDALSEETVRLTGTETEEDA
jgi:hypothetical protein